MAYFMDCLLVFSLIMLIFQWLILTPIRGYFVIDNTWFHDSLNMQLYVLLTISLPVWFYFAFLDSCKSNGTYGKRLMNLNVLNKDYLTKISFQKSFMRAIFKLFPWEIAHIGVIFPEPLYYAKNPDVRILTIIGIILFMVYFISIAIDKNSQSVYDKILGVMVKNKS